MAGRRHRGTVVALAGLAALVLAAPVLRERASGPRAPASAPVVAAGPEGPPPASRPAAVPARPVAPHVAGPQPVSPQVLERVDAREPLGPIGRAPAPSEGPPEETVLYRPLAEAAGRFGAMGYEVMLAGLRPTPADRVCGAGEAAWPCGVHARTAFRNWLRGRALACIVPPVPPGEVVVTSCRLGHSDAGEWLVGQGWALAADGDGRYAALEEEARRAGRGLHGAAPAVPAPPAVTVPEATPAAPDEDSAPPVSGD